MRHLAEAWLRTAAAVDAHGDVAGAGANLLGRWAEPQRRYHDLAHLDSVLRTIELLSAAGAGADDLDAVRLGAWFHDAVYDPTATDNEARSALLARKVLMDLRVADERVATVVRLVTSTADHAPADGDGDAALLCDADLAVLATDADTYARYADAVREEYEHLDDATFTAGRARVLRSLLDRPALYRTAHGHAAWETTARENMRRELESLGT